MTMRFFVYGTLLRGFGNHKLIKDLVSVTPAVIHGVRVAHFHDGGFPGLYHSESLQDSVLGEMMVPVSGKEEVVRVLLDELEEYHPDDPIKPSMYERRLVQASPLNVDEAEEAWAYFCVAEGWMEECKGLIIEPVEGKPVSWKAYVEENELPTAGGDWADGKYAERLV